MHDAEQSFALMLPKETAKVNYMAEESAYFTNQTFKEARRVVMLDYTMSREHFVDMGEQMQRHIYMMNQGWGQMLDFYTDLNNARKEKDDAYLEQNCIGEEIIEPDEKPVGIVTNLLDEAETQSQIKKKDWDEGSEVDTNDMLEQLKQQLISEDLAEAEKK